MELKYNKPAKNWNEALPIGNGRLGAMVFGGVEKEHIQLNEESLWYGKKQDRNNPDALIYLDKIRNLIFEGKIKEAEELSVKALSGIPEGQRHYETLGDLYINFNHNGKISDYTRTLDTSNAVAFTKYNVDGINFEREYFSDYENNVIAIKLSSDKPVIDFSLRLVRLHHTNEVKSLNNSIYISGGEGIDFTAGAYVKSDNVEIIGDSINVKNVNCAYIYITCYTTFRTANTFEECKNTLDKAVSLNYYYLLNNHIADYKKYFERMDIKLGESIDLPTDERIERVKNGETDLELISLMFQYGRYLLISSSREGTLPANLQGIWNDSMLPKWDSKFTININTQMNYWPVETCNLSELHQPLFELIKRMLPNGKKTAEIMYGCRGFVAHHNTDIWADTAPQDRYIPATYWVMGAAWLCTHIWEHYLFTLDIDFLREHYECIKQASLFFVDFLVENNRGELVTCPSLSPENTYILPNGEKGCICAGSTMDNQILRHLFKANIKAAEVLNIDNDFVDSLKEKLNKIPEMKIGKHGQIIEWLDDYEEIDPGHKHISHLYALHPDSEINAFYTPKLAAAAKKTLERRLKNGGGHTGWSRAWIINMYARLGSGDEALANIKELISKSTLPNLLDNHPPFQIDGNFGLTSGLAEMLLQSHMGEIHILPALPSEFETGYVKGLKARGDYTVDISWAKNKVNTIKIHSKYDNSLKIRAIDGLHPIDFECLFNDGVYEVSTKANCTYVFVKNL